MAILQIAIEELELLITMSEGQADNVMAEKRQFLAAVFELEELPPVGRLKIAALFFGAELSHRAKRLRIVEVGEQALIGGGVILIDLPARLALTDENISILFAELAIAVGSIFEQPFARVQPGQGLGGAGGQFGTVLSCAELIQLQFSLQKRMFVAAVFPLHQSLGQLQASLFAGIGDRAEHADERAQLLEVVGLTELGPLLSNQFFQRPAVFRCGLVHHGDDAATRPDIGGSLDLPIVDGGHQLGLFAGFLGKLLIFLERLDEPTLLLAALANQPQVGSSPPPLLSFELGSFFLRCILEIELAQLFVVLEVLLGVIEVIGNIDRQRIIQFGAGLGACFLAGMILKGARQVVDGALQIALVQTQLATLRQGIGIVGIFGDQLVHLGNLDLELRISDYLALPFVFAFAERSD